MKVIVCILVLLLAVTGALGVYSFNLEKQIGTLSDELTTFRNETATQIGTLSDELTTQIGSLSDELTTFKDETATQIGTLSDELEGVSGEISQSVVNVIEVYEKAKKGVVEVFVGAERQGSGFVFEAEGYIVTNYHVVERATRIEVVLYDGTTSRASIIGSCKYSDIAVFKLTGEVSLEPLELADSNAVPIGEPVVAIGSPFGLPGTVTSGIVSQKGRAAHFAGGKEPYYLIANLIQYSAASNPGSSGGPLLNSKGEVIGMVIGGYPFGEGVNLAISSNKVERVARSLIDSGSFKNPTLPGNWRLDDLSVEEARAKKLETAGGILVIEADQAAVFEANDIIVGIDGVTVRGVADLYNYLGEDKSSGDTVTLTVIRHKAEMTMSVKLAKGGMVFDGEAFQSSAASGW